MTLNQIQYQQHLEQRRANLEKESQGRTGLRETQRHNVATEAAQERQIDVTQRHYNNQDAIASSQLAEQIAHNRVTEAETQRHNIQGEKVSRDTLSESQRHNRETESLGERQRETNLTTGLVSAGTRSRNPVVQSTLLGLAGIGTNTGVDVLRTGVSNTAQAGRNVLNWSNSLGYQYYPQLSEETKKVQNLGGK